MGPTLSTPETSLLSTLLTPLKLGPLTLRNKFMMSALTRDRCYPTNVPTEMMVEYYRQRAKGGVGLIISEGALIERQGTEWPHAPGIWSDDHVLAWKKITEAVHEEGTCMYAQLWHVGRVRHHDAPEQIASGMPVSAPSPIAARFGKFRFLPGEPPCSTPIEIQDPLKFVDLYRQAALKAKEAGFDGVEIHAGGGYLIHTFLDSTSNYRKDEYGGSVRNRCRFGLEVLEVVSEIFGANRVGVKLTPCSGHNDMGMSLNETLDTYSYFITEADKLGLAYIALVRDIELLSPVIDGMKRGTPHDVILSYKPLFKNSLFFLNGDYNVIEAADAIASGRVHGVFFGRPFINNPDLPNRIERRIPLNTNLDIYTLYGPSDGVVKDIEILRKGYTDYPVA